MAVWRSTVGTVCVNINCDIFPSFSSCCQHLYFLDDFTGLFSIDHFVIRTKGRNIPIIDWD